MFPIASFLMSVVARAVLAAVLGGGWVGVATNCFTMVSLGAVGFFSRAAFEAIRKMFFHLISTVGAEAAAAATGATMVAPGAAGYVISRAAFESNPKLYFELLRTVGAKAAAAAFA
ncbi:hypothetical protein GUJ93_ZPchr0013g36609 [Zizania palustris]|uniref:Uncharacterized protein n=1 Tax=Zizania palustris TaxID=103762 RepID=A0A8J5X0P9_ZIZPA|nr:hypothetical protein GUJ93_ZPchr0013g36609 [Zizania palustris]